MSYPIRSENDEINLYTDEDIAIEQMMRWYIELLDTLNKKKSALKILAPLFELKRTSAGTNMEAFLAVDDHSKIAINAI